MYRPLLHPRYHRTVIRTSWTRKFDAPVDTCVYLHVIRLLIHISAPIIDVYVLVGV